METLEGLRREIDLVDDEIVAALGRRFTLAAKVRELKRREGLPAKDEAREKEIFARLLSKCDPAERDVVYSVYERIFGGSRGLIETVARGVAVLDGKVLLCRSKGGSATYLPGGHIEFGETGREALVREVKEETGLDSRAGEFLGVLENSFLQHGKAHSEINLVYRLELSDPQAAERVVAQESWIEYEWAGVDDLDGVNLLPEDIRGMVKA